MSGAAIGAQGELATEWDRYTQALRSAQIRLVQRDDTLIWDHHLSGIYTPKAGYNYLSNDIILIEEEWWWKHLWKLHCPHKCKIFYWAVITNKAPTWDILQKRTFADLGWCIMCKLAGQSIYHLFMECEFSKKTWEVAYRLENIRSHWNGDSMESALREWVTNRGT